MPAGVEPEHPSGGRRHQHEVGGLAEVGVRDRVRLVPQRRPGPLGAERVEGGAPDEVQRPLGEDRDHVGAGVDEAAADLDGLVGGDAPRTRRGRCACPRAWRVDGEAAYSADSVSSSTASVALGLGIGPDAEDLVGGDLLEGDRQRLAGRRGDLRRHDGAEALGQLVVVRVDLPSPLGAQGDQGELRAGPLEEALDRAGSSSCRGATPWRILFACDGDKRWYQRDSGRAGIPRPVATQPRPMDLGIDGQAGGRGGIVGRLGAGDGPGAGGRRCTGGDLWPRPGPLWRRPRQICSRGGRRGRGLVADVCTIDGAAAFVERGRRRPRWARHPRAQRRWPPDRAASTPRTWTPTAPPSS